MAKRKSPPVPDQNQVYNNLLAQSLINRNTINQVPSDIPIGMGGNLQYGQELLPPGIPIGMGGEAQYATLPPQLSQNIPIMPVYSQQASKELPLPPPIDPAMLAEYNRFLSNAIQSQGSQQQFPPTARVRPVVPEFNPPPAARVRPVVPEFNPPPAANIPPMPLPATSAATQAPTFNSLMAMQNYNNLMQQQLNAVAANRLNESSQQGAQPPVQPTSRIAQNYANLTPGQGSQINGMAPFETITATPPMPQSFGSVQQQKRRSSNSNAPRSGFGYLPQNQIAPVGF